MHLTDLHQGMWSQDWLWPNVRQEFFADLGRLHETCGPWDVVLFTGDLTQKGTAEEFEKLDETLAQLWEDVQLFLAHLNMTVPELGSELPTEAQWEYACRAGTNTATYAGPMQLLGKHNASVLDPIAWYGGNSGVDWLQRGLVRSGGVPSRAGARLPQRQPRFPPCPRLGSAQASKQASKQAEPAMQRRG